ncbi:MAG: aminopeptidase P N-terminal domain-containing protein [Clostridiales bacterium]|nr:aminopeptidase P N-terminal domain-containing protein [Clostridiales bacterium]
MNASYFTSNRQRLAEALKPGSLVVLFSGEELRKTNDEYYPFFADRNFVYLTGLTCKEAALLLLKEQDGAVRERLYLLPPDAHAERWTGRRIQPDEATAVSGVAEVRYVPAFQADLHLLAASGRYERLYLDLYRCSPDDVDRPAHRLCALARREYPFLQIGNANAPLRALRTIKQPCEIEALRRAEEITGEGIRAMMRLSRPGLYEYQYKAAFDHALGQHGPAVQGFPPIISAGDNNFCIHYYSYTGQAQDGDMILNDVGAQYQNMITDVSRGWPCNGKFTERQRLLYECALSTSNHMFSIIRPGMRMQDVDATIRNYNAERLVEAGVMASVEDIGTYMWHGGAHHISYDVHDVVKTPEVLAPGMVFCVDVGIYHEAWGIGFRLEDNCLVTETGCENLSAAIPRTVEEIEAVMAGAR